MERMTGRKGSRRQVEMVPILSDGKRHGEGGFASSPTRGRALGGSADEKNPRAGFHYKKRRRISPIRRCDRPDLANGGSEPPPTDYLKKAGRDVDCALRCLVAARGNRRSAQRHPEVTMIAAAIDRQTSKEQDTY